MGTSAKTSWRIARLALQYQRTARDRGSKVGSADSTVSRMKRSRSKPTMYWVWTTSRRSGPSRRSRAASNQFIEKRSSPSRKQTTSARVASTPWRRAAPRSPLSMTCRRARGMFSADASICRNVVSSGRSRTNSACKAIPRLARCACTRPTNSAVLRPISLSRWKLATSARRRALTPPPSGPRTPRRAARSDSPDR